MGLSKHGLDTHFKKHSFQCAIPFETSRFDSLSIANQLNRSMVVCEQLPFSKHCSALLKRKLPNSPMILDGVNSSYMFDGQERNASFPFLSLPILSPKKDTVIQLLAILIPKCLSPK